MTSATSSERALAPDTAELTPRLTIDDRTQLLRYMLLVRAIEERGLSLYKQGKVPGSFYDGRGQEAISVGATFALSGDDAVCSPLIRDLGAHLVRGTDLTELFRHYFGRANALNQGREGNVHFGDRHLGVVGMVSMLPDMMLVACGLALAYQMRHEPRVALSFFGEGATSPGGWHEAMNWAALDGLPAVFVLEDNQTAYSTPSSRQFPVDPIQRADGYAMASEDVDGNDVEAVFGAVHRGRERALRGDGPTLVVARTMRMHGHGAHDDARYVPAELLERWRLRDPINSYVASCDSLGIDVGSLRADIDAAIDEAVARALETPMPDPGLVTDGVFCEGEAEPLGSAESLWSGHTGLM